MLKETIVSHDLDGNEITKDYYFNFFESEVAELKYQYKDGIDKYVERMQQANDVGEVIKVIKELILKAYGERDPEDPSRFVKSEELREKFSQTEAYSNLFMKLGTDAKAAAEFIKGITPRQLREETPNPIPPAKKGK